MSPGNAKRTISAILGVLCVLSFLAIVLVGGHAAAPMGVVLVESNTQAEGLTSLDLIVYLEFGGFLCLVCAVIAIRFLRVYLAFAGMSLLCLLSSFEIITVQYNQSAELTMISAIPFLVVAVAQLACLVWIALDLGPRNPLVTPTDDAPR